MNHTKLFGIGAIVVPILLFVNPAWGQDAATEYNDHCALCHDSDLTGAPQLGNSTEWQKRFDARGLEGVYNSAINGITGTAMPACADSFNGGVPDDAQCRQIVNYILYQSEVSIVKTHLRVLLEGALQ